MAIPLSKTAKTRSKQTSQTPALVLDIDGVPNLYGVGDVQTLIRIGDPDLYIGNDWVIGGFRTAENSRALISFEGTTTTINQQLLQDKGGTSSVGSLAISLLDENEEATQLITPGEVVDDVLGRKARIWIGYQDSAFPRDYSILVNGVIDEIQSGGTIVLNVAHPEQKKRQEIFPVIKTKLDGAINNSVTTITLDDVSGLLSPADGTTLRTYVRINDEIIQYNAVNTGTNQITGCTRGQLGTTATSHADQDDVASFYRLTGTAMDLALKIMLSHPSEPNYVEDIEVGSFVQVTPSEAVPNAIFFNEIDVGAQYGVVVGDFITTTGAANGANNVALSQIASIEVIDEGSYLVLTSGALVVESDTAAVAAFKSKYNVLTEGLRMGGDEVDVARFEEIDTAFGSNLLDYDFYLIDTMNAKDFIDKEIFFPAALYSLPRKGRCSVGYTSPPIRTGELRALDSDNVTMPNKLKIKRSTNKWFYNTVLYSYDIDPLDGEFKSGFLSIDEDSKNQIQVGSKIFKVESRGMRSGPSNDVILQSNSRRFLERYKFAAEELVVKPLYGDSFNVEVGDVVLFGDENLQLPDSKNGSRDFQRRLFEIVNKKINIKTGDVELNLVDTNYLVNARYGIFSPASIIGSGSTTTQLRIVDSYGTDPGSLESDKWDDYIGETIMVHDENWTYTEETTLTGFSGGDPYLMNVSPALSGAPPAGYIIDIPLYPTSTNPELNATYKNIHAFIDPKVDVVTGISVIQFTVGAGDVGKFFVGSTVLVHNDDFSVVSPEVRVTDITGVTITVGETLTFTPTSAYDIELIGFPDGLSPYRYI